MQEIVIGVGGMSCQGCVKNITGLLTQINGVNSAQVSLENENALIDFDPAKTSPEAFKNAIEEAGFDVL